MKSPILGADPPSSLQQLLWQGTLRPPQGDDEVDIAWHSFAWWVSLRSIFMIDWCRMNRNTNNICICNVYTSQFWYRYSFRTRILHNSVDGRNPKQPPGMYKNPVNYGISTTNLNWWVFRIISINGIRFLPWEFKKHLATQPESLEDKAQQKKKKSCFSLGLWQQYPVSSCMVRKKFSEKSPRSKQNTPHEFAILHLHFWTKSLFPKF